MRYERELGNDLGNLLSRTTAMIAKYCDGTLPAQGRSPEVAEAIAAVHALVPGDLDAFNVTVGIDRVWSLVRELNRYVTETAPWTVAKDEARVDELHGILYDLADGLRAAAVALWPYLPETAPRILAALGQPLAFDWERVQPGRLEPAAGVEPAAPLFPRIETADAA